jgi:hypothetical protein
MLERVPKWVSTDSFEIEAVAEGNPTEDQMRLMVRSLLTDRFRLQAHTVTSQASVIALILDKPGATGPKLRPHSEGQPCDAHLASPAHAVGVFPPTCESMLAVDTPHGAVQQLGLKLKAAQAPLDTLICRIMLSDLRKTESISGADSPKSA